jgi:hypothetical protein
MIWKILLAVWFLWWLWRVMKYFYRHDRNYTQRAKERNNAYALENEQNWALALAHPAAMKRIKNGFADSVLPPFTESLTAILRPALLHYFGLRVDSSDEVLREFFTKQLPAKWFTLDLKALHSEDDAKDIMAFACARLAFAVRCAACLTWLDQEMQWRILEFNAQRARECFSSWQEFGQACARGRRQWLSQSRSDSLGTNFSEDDVGQWLQDPHHPWCTIPWS